MHDVLKDLIDIADSLATLSGQPVLLESKKGLLSLANPDIAKARQIKRIAEYLEIISQTDLKGEQGDRGDKGETGEQGEAGEAGENGQDGNDGERGEQGEVGPIGPQGKSGRDGLDGSNGVDGVDGADGVDGRDGVDGDDGSPDTPEQILEKLKKLKAEDQFINNSVLNRAISILDQRTQFLINKTVKHDTTLTGSGTDADPLKVANDVNATWGSITGTLSTQTDLQDALNTKENSITAGTTAQYWRGDKTFQTLDKTAVGLGNVDNTSDANKPVSSATQTALNLKANTADIPTLASGTYTPADTAHANLTGNDVTMTEAQYMRVGSTVTVSGRFTGTATLTATTTSFEITLPVASNIGAVEDVAGGANCGNIVSMSAEVTGVVANDTAKIFWKASDITSQSWSYQFTYQII